MYVETRISNEPGLCFWDAGESLWPPSGRPRYCSPPIQPSVCEVSVYRETKGIFFSLEPLQWAGAQWCCIALSVSQLRERRQPKAGVKRRGGEGRGVTPCFFSAPMFPLAVFVAQHCTMGAFVCWGVEAEAILFQSFLEVLCLRRGGGLMLSCGCLLFPLSPFIQSFSVFSLSPSLLLHLSFSLCCFSLVCLLLALKG